MPARATLCSGCIRQHPLGSCRKNTVFPITVVYGAKQGLVCAISHPAASVLWDEAAALNAQC